MFLVANSRGLGHSFWTLCSHASYEMPKYQERSVKFTTETISATLTRTNTWTEELRADSKFSTDERTQVSDSTWP